MDTVSHFVLGATLGGLAIALSDPVVGDHSTVMYGLFAAAIVGSNAPDFDIVARLLGHDSYVLHHRGFSHSLPMIVGWPLLIAPLIAALFNAWDAIHLLLLWTMAGVVFHVFLDYFNVYGVQCFRPFSRTWFHGDAIPIFDPIIFVLHAMGLMLWLCNIVTAIVFPIVYLLTFIFIGCRILLHRLMLQAVRKHYGTEGHSFLIPRLLPYKWGYVYETDQTYVAGSTYGTLIKEELAYTKGEQNEVVQTVMAAHGVHRRLSLADK